MNFRRTISKNEDIPIILFNLLEFYPSRNLVEAYLYSKLGTDKNNHHTLLNLWDETLRGIQDLKDTLKLLIQECQGLDEQTNQCSTKRRRGRHQNRSDRRLVARKGNPRITGNDR